MTRNPSLEELIDNILQAISLVGEPLEVLGGRVWSLREEHNPEIGILPDELDFARDFLDRTRGICLWAQSEIARLKENNIT